MPDEQHVYHHNDDKPKLAIKVERNSRGINWEISISNCKDLDVAMGYLDNAEYELRQRYEKTEHKEIT